MIKKILGYIILSQLVCVGAFMVYLGNCAAEVSKVGFKSAWIASEIVTAGISIFLGLLILALDWIEKN